MTTYHYRFMPDSLQFYLLEEGAFEGVYEDWTHEEAERNLWLREGALGIWTYPNMGVTSDVTIDLCDYKPALEEGHWQRINECSLIVRMGWLGLSYYGFPGVRGVREPTRWAGWDGKLFAIEPNSYRVRIYYDDQSALAEKIALDIQAPPTNGEMYDWREHFKIVLWPAPWSEFKVLKAASQVKVPQRDERWQQLS